MENPLAGDLDYILEKTKGLWEEIRGKQVFITGGTGFFGCWLLESFAWANDFLGLGAKVLVLTRNLEAFKLKVPHLASHAAIKFHIGDVRDFKFPSGEFSHIIHAAGQASAELNEEEPLTMLDVIIEGTRHVLNFALSCGAKKILLTSSGAVYGMQPPEITHIPETYNGAPELIDQKSAYGEGKRLAELLCVIYAKQYGIEPKIARCFTFVGPYLPLNIHFAVGNFLQDALKGGPIIIRGDGTPYRSYMYAADLAIWLWAILFIGESCQPYNVGSDIEMTIAQVADIVANSFTPRPAIHISQPLDTKKRIERYVPSVEKAKQRLRLSQKILLPDAIKKTISFLHGKEKSKKDLEKA